MIVKKIKLICLKPVPGNPIEVSVKIKALTVENPPTKKKIIINKKIKFVQGT